jgi:hypothetical protein
LEYLFLGDNAKSINYCAPLALVVWWLNFFIALADYAKDCAPLALHCTNAEIGSKYPNSRVSTKGA